MKPTLIIRADGGTSIGMGHVVRCLALAAMLENDFEIRFAICDPAESIIQIINSVTPHIIALPPMESAATDAVLFAAHVKPGDTVLLDGYHFKTEYQQLIKEKGAKLAVIDDLHAWHHVADVIINHADGVDRAAYSAESYTQLCLGPQYALLRKPFLEAGAAKKIETVSRVFISMGAADVDNLTQKFTEALIANGTITEIHLMLGAINPHLESIRQLIENNKRVQVVTHFNISAEELAALLKKCDVSICPASSISLESCAVGIGLLSGYTAENQLGILQGLLDHGAALNFGDLRAITPAELSKKLAEIVQQPLQLNALVANQKKMIDGHSPDRLRRVFNELAAAKLRFRFAGERDAELYYEWTNDAAVRNNSFQQDKVSYESHVAWFRKKLHSGSCFFYLFSDENDVPAGQVRIEQQERETVIGISVAAAYRGKSLSVEMLQKATRHYLQQFPDAIIVAYIKTENTASYSSFKKAGFSGEEITEVQGCKSYKLYKKGSTT